jgi:hypothetical protein
MSLNTDEINATSQMEVHDLICFSNPGEIDIAAVTTLGVSVKPNPGSIGMFGTGLKYSIAVALREGLDIILRSGKAEYGFELKKQRIRGEDFEIVHMFEYGDDLYQKGPRQSLHFTTSYGRNWTLENVYRELWSNMRDEHGEVRRLSMRDLTPPKEGETQIIVKGGAFASVHARRFEFLLNPVKPKLAEYGGLEILAGQSEQVFYRGIGAYKLPKPSLYTYNITSEQVLTEDRTLASGTYYLNDMISKALLQIDQEYLIKDLLIAGETFHEHELSFPTYLSAGETYLAVCQRLIVDHPLEANTSAIEMYLDKTKRSDADFTEITPTEEEQERLDSALARIAGWGFDYAAAFFTVGVAEFVGNNCLARINGGTRCMLKREIIQDTDLLEHALIEEFVHMRFSVPDNSRAMQNVLFREIIRLGRKLSETEGDARIPLTFPPQLPPDPEDEIPF